MQEVVIPLYKQIIELMNTQTEDGAIGYFNKKNFPDFSGKYRDYPELKKYWSECVQPEFEIVPAVVNLRQHAGRVLTRVERVRGWDGRSLLNMS